MLFCLFAEDVGLLPKQLVTSMITSRADDPQAFTDGLTDVFRRMSDREASRYFGNDRIEWFNGGLFDDDSALAFTRDEMRTVAEASTLDWSQVEPAILGTLFERGLDPDKRGQLGAHYTDREKILMVVEPVVMIPLRREFAAMQDRVDKLMKDREPSPLTREGKRRERLPMWELNAEAEWRGFLKRLRDVRVLDPACGSGNFLYVTLRLLKDLEQETIRWGAERLRITGEFPRVDPAQHARHRDQSLRQGTGRRRHLDRPHPVDARPRLRVPPRPGAATARQHRAARRHPRLRRGRKAGPGDVAGGGVHRR